MPGGIPGPADETSVAAAEAAHAVLHHLQLALEEVVELMRRGNLEWVYAKLGTFAQQRPDLGYAAACLAAEFVIQSLGMRDDCHPARVIITSPSGAEVEPEDTAGVEKQLWIARFLAARVNRDPDMSEALFNASPDSAQQKLWWLLGLAATTQPPPTPVLADT